MKDNTRCINLLSVSSKFRHSLRTNQETYLPFSYFYLKTINPSFLLWKSQQDLLSLLVPSAAIKRCRVSECDQLLHRGPATVSENIQSSQTSLENLPGDGASLPTLPSWGTWCCQQRSPLSTEASKDPSLGPRSLEATRLQNWTVHRAERRGLALQ